jgi:hypothetical protein
VGIEFVFDVFEFLLFLQFENVDSVLKLAVVARGLVEIVAESPVGKRDFEWVVVDDAFFFHFDLITLLKIQWTDESL